MKNDDRNNKYSHVLTGDGTISIHVREYQQAMHSISGAYEEALYKHVFPSGILNAGKEEIRVLDIGFGLGYNILALLTCCEGNPGIRQVRVISLENDPSVTEIIPGIVFNDERDCMYRKIVHAAVTGEYKDSGISIRVIFGDARQSLASLQGQLFDAVFHDPFSPAMNPELWTVEFFQLLYTRVNPEAVLTTYSAALQVRRAMIEAGFVVGKGPSVGGKREGTLATIDGHMEKLPLEDLDSIRSERKSTPYRDVSGADSRDGILQRRRQEMKRRNVI